MTTGMVTRRTLLRKGLAGAALGAGALALPGLARADGPESVQVAEIYQLQAAFHRATTTQDLDLMMSLWAEDATFLNASTGKRYGVGGSDTIRSFWQGSGSFTHHRFSLVPSYKTTIEVDGNEAFLYFECHDVVLDANDPAGPVGSIVTHLTNFGMIRRVGGSWLYWQMHFGSAAPLSVDTIYDT